MALKPLKAFFKTKPAEEFASDAICSGHLHGGVSGQAQDRFCVLKSLVVLVAYRSPSDRNPASVHIVNDYACRVVSAPPKTGRRMGAPVPAPPDGCAFVVEDQVNRLSPRFEFRARSTSEVERWTSSFSALGKSMRVGSHRVTSPRASRSDSLVQRITTAYDDELDALQTKWERTLCEVKDLSTKVTVLRNALRSERQAVNSCVAQLQECCDQLSLSASHARGASEPADSPLDALQHALALLWGSIQSKAVLSKAQCDAQCAAAVTDAIARDAGVSPHDKNLKMLTSYLKAYDPAAVSNAPTLLARFEQSNRVEVLWTMLQLRFGRSVSSVVVSHVPPPAPATSSTSQLFLTRSASSHTPLVRSFRADSEEFGPGLMLRISHSSSEDNAERFRAAAGAGLSSDGGVSAEDERPPVLSLYGPPKWIPDTAVVCCQICCKAFTLGRRRHHCRACGRVICAECSPPSTAKVRPEFATLQEQEPLQVESSLENAKCIMIFMMRSVGESRLPQGKRNGKKSTGMSTSPPPDESTRLEAPISSYGALSGDDEELRPMVDVIGVPVVPHDDSNCPHTIPKRHCKGKLSRPAFCGLVISGILIASGLIVFGAIYFVGEVYAETALNDADIVFSMEITEIFNSSFTTNVVGNIDNRNVFGATMESTRMKLGFAGNYFGYMDFPSITLLGGNLTYLNLNETVIVTDQAAFDQFGISLFRDDYVIIELYAHINVAALGMRYTNIEFRKLMTIQGMGKFQDPPPVVLNQTIFQGTPTELYMNLFVSLYNSAPVTIDNMGPLNMTLFLGKTILGDAASVGNVSMTSGLVISNWIGRVVLSDSNSHEISEILGRYASGDSVTLTMKGRNDSSIIPLLQHSIAAMEINCTLQGLTHNEDKLLQMGYVFMNLSAISSGLDPETCGYANETNPRINGSAFQDAYLYALDPFPAPITLEAMDFNLWWTAQTTTAASFLGNCRGNDLSISVPGNSIAVVKERICLTENIQAFEVAFATFVFLNGIATNTPFNFNIKANGTVTGRLQGFVLTFNYTQEFNAVAQYTL